MENKSNQFDGLWIPVEILSNQNLNANEKLVLSIIKALDKGQGCFASNKYIAELIGLESRSMTAIISKLKEKGFVDVTIEGYNTRTIKYIEQAGEQTTVEETEEVPANVIPIKSKSIIWRGIDLSTWDEEALERLKRRYPEVIDLLEGKKINQTKQPKFRTNEEIINRNYAGSNDDVVELTSDIDNSSKQLKLVVKAE